MYINIMFHFIQMGFVTKFFNRVQQSVKRSVTLISNNGRKHFDLLSDSNGSLLVATNHDLFH